MNEADPRVIRTRKLLTEALVSLLSEKSFHTISVQDIADRATLNRATFYAHFEDKFALMDHLVRKTFREEVQMRVGAPATFTLDRLHLLVVTVCEFIEKFHGHCAPTVRTMEPPIEAKVQDELQAFLLEWLHADIGTPAAGRVPPEAVAAIMSWAIFGAGMEWSRSERRDSVNAWARRVVAILLTGATRGEGEGERPQVRKAAASASSTALR